MPQAYGCVAVSDPIEIIIIRCPCWDCVSATFESITCYFNEVDGTQHYLWTVNLEFYCSGNGATFTVKSPNGQVLLTSGTNLVYGVNTITGIFIDPPPPTELLCLQFTIEFSGRICVLEICQEGLPNCKPEPCSFDFEKPQIFCMGQNSQGMNVYNFSFLLHSPDDYEILITTLLGTVTGTPTHIWTGPNIISGQLLTDIDTWQVCFYISAYNRRTGEVCYYLVCMNMPDCDCYTNIDICKVECAGFDPSTGNPIYYFEACINSSIDQFLTIISQTGNVTGQSTMQIYQGTNVISGYYSPSSSSDTIVCFIFEFVYDNGSAETFYRCDLCASLPRCNEPDPCPFTTVTITGANCWGVIGGNPQYLVYFSINSPPLGYALSVTSNTGTVSGVHPSGTKAGYVHTSAGSVACFTFTFISTTEPTPCIVTVCDTLPNCNAIPLADSCAVVRTAEWMHCMGADVYGNRIYMFEATVTTSVPYMILPYTAQGSIHLPVMQLDSGYNQLIGLFIDSMPFDTAMSIVMNALHPDSLTLCYFDIDFDTITVCNPARQVTWGFQQSQVESSGLALHLIPNPARESTSIVYKFNSEAENRIYIMDMQGRIIHSYAGLGSAGVLRYNTADLPNGIYFVVAQSENNLKLAEKLVIIK